MILIVSNGPIPGIIVIPVLDTGDIHLDRAKSIISQSTLEVGEVSYIIVPEFMPNMVISQSAYDDVPSSHLSPVVVAIIVEVK